MKTIENIKEIEEYDRLINAVDLLKLYCLETARVNNRGKCRSAMSELKIWKQNLINKKQNLIDKNKLKLGVHN